MEFSDFPDVLALKDDVIVEFVCKGQSCKFRAREMEGRRKEKAVDDALQSVELVDTMSQTSKDCDKT